MWLTEVNFEGEIIWIAIMVSSHLYIKCKPPKSYCVWVGNKTVKLESDRELTENQSRLIVFILMLFGYKVVGSRNI